MLGDVTQCHRGYDWETLPAPAAPPALSCRGGSATNDDDDRSPARVNNSPGRTHTASSALLVAADGAPGARAGTGERDALGEERPWMDWLRLTAVMRRLLLRLGTAMLIIGAGAGTGTGEAVTVAFEFVVAAEGDSRPPCLPR